MTQAISVDEKSGSGLLKVAAGGAVTGLLTPLLPPPEMFHSNDSSSRGASGRCCGIRSE